MLGMDDRKKGWITAVAMLVAVFMAGALSAVAAITVLERGEAVSDRGPPIHQSGRDGPRRFDGSDRPRFDGHRGFLDRLTRELDLSEDQRERIEAILMTRGPRTEEIMSQVRERLRIVMDSVDAEIRAVLTPEQFEAFDRLETRGREGLERRFPRRPEGRAPRDRRGPPSDG